MKTERPRKSGESTEDWLMPDSQTNPSFGLEGSLVSWDETWPYEVEPHVFDGQCGIVVIIMNNTTTSHIY